MKFLVPLLLKCTLVSATLFVGCQHKIIQSGNTLPADYGFFMFAFSLNRCPADNYFPAQRKAIPGASFEAGYFDGPYCHGFTKYALSAKMGLTYADTAPIYLRLQAGTPCNLYVAMPTERMCTGQTLEKCASYQSALKLVTFFLKINFGDGEGDFTPQPSTLNVNGFNDHGDFEQWCAARIRKKTDSTAHPTFQLQPPQKSSVSGD